jgi:hypothetical protein
LPAGTTQVKFQAISAFGNNLYLDNVQVYQPVCCDVSTASIDFGQVASLGFTPLATVKNEGTAVQTFNVTMTIGTYTSTKTVTALASGTTQQVTFDPCSLAAGDYSVSVCTALTGDLVPANNCKTSTVKLLDLNKTVYAYNAYPVTGTDPIGPTSFSLATPGTLNSIADQSTLQFVQGATWANGTWYGCVYNTVTPYQFVSIDPATGARTVIGDLGLDFTAISYNTVNSTMYGIGYNGTSSLLYTINMATGATTLIGTAAAADLLISLAIDNSGNAYAIALGSDQLGHVNLTTGAWTAIGAIGFDANYGQSMDFDRATGNLYYAAFGASGSLMWLNTTTGAALLIGAFEGGAEVTGLAIPYTSNKTFNLSVWLEALYNGGGTMRAAFDESGPHWGPTIADHITVQLNDGTSGALVTSFPDVVLSTSGAATITVPSSYSGSYWVTVKHRNSVPTCSAAPISFAGSAINYSFDVASKAFGSNMLIMEDGAAVMFAGDVNQDYAVDSGDYGPVDNDVANFAAGYLNSDVNGDGSIDSGDYGSIDNNNAAFVGAALPY